MSLPTLMMMGAAGFEVPGFELWAWGEASQGQLGNDLNTPALSSPSQIDSNKIWAEVYGGARYALARRNDGTLWSWGWNDQGQLGLGDTATRSSPVQIGTDTDWVHADAPQNSTGLSFGLGLRANGTVYAWGDNSQGQLGNTLDTNDSSSPTQVGAETDWSLISAGRSHAAAIKTDGTLWTWGDGDKGQLGDGSTADKSSPVQIGADTNWAAVTAGDQFTMALRTDNTLWTWGDATAGLLGNGQASTSESSPIQIDSGNTYSSICFKVHDVPIAVQSNGTLWAWGTASSGTNGSISNRSLPTQISSNTDWTGATVSAGSSHAHARKTDGTIWAWGESNNGRKGTGDSQPDTSSPAQIGTDSDWIGIATGLFNGYALKQ